MPFKTRMPEQKCEVCGHTLDTASHLTDEIKPRDGDFTLCIECGSVYRFQIDMSLRLARQDELCLVDQDELKNLSSAISMVNKIKPYN